MCTYFNVFVCVNIPGWVNELVGGQHPGAKGFMFFSVNVDLTENGIGNVFIATFLLYMYVEDISQFLFYCCYLENYWLRFVIHIFIVVI